METNHTDTTPVGSVSCGSFSKALDAVKAGSRIYRNGWNGKGMYVFLNNPGRPGELAFLSIKTITGEFIPFTASQSDILSNDWVTYGSAVIGNS